MQRQFRIQFGVSLSDNLKSKTRPFDKLRAGSLSYAAGSKI